ncbi:ribonuclease H-like domain-containing protein, partial [Tanacetum coccineum]
MEELLQAHTEGYEEAIVIPEINADHFEIKTNLLQLVQANPFHGFERENPHTHINNFKRITSTLKFRDVPNDVIKLMMFPYSLEGAAVRNKMLQEMDPYNHSTPTSTKLLILDTGKFEQWKFRIQQYLQHEYYALWEVIEFGDSYKAPPEETGKGVTSEGSAKKKGRTMAITVEDMQKRRNNVKARTTLLLALPDEHQLRFSKYDNVKELWEAILKTFGGNEATKKTKKNQLKQQYGNFKAEGSETLEQTFNRLQAIVSHLEFMDVPIEQDDLNQKFLSSLAPEWLVYTIVWRNRDDLDTMSLDDVYNHLKVYEPEVQKSAGSNSQNMAFISSSNTNSGKYEVPTVQGVSTTSAQTASVQVSTASTDVAAASLSYDTVCAFIATQPNGSQIKYEDITQIDDDDIEEMDIKWNLALLSMRADRFWKKTGKKITIQGSDVAGFDKSKDWRYMANEDENHALVADDVVPTECALMAMSSSSSSLDNELRDNKIENLKNELEEVKKEKESIDFKIEKFDNASKDLDSLLENQRLVKDKKGLGFNEYNIVPPPPAQVYSPPKKDLSWMGLPEFVDDTVTDYSRPTTSIDVSKDDSEDEREVDFTLNETVRPSIEQAKFDKFTRELGKDFVMQNKACYNCGSFEHLKLDCKQNIWVVKGKTLNCAQPKMTSFVETAHSHVKRPFARKSAAKNKVWVPTVRTKFPTVGSKVPTAKPTVAADKGIKGKAVKTSACWIWKTKQYQGSNLNGVSGIPHDNIYDKGYWNSGCSRHITGNISYLSEFEPFNGGYVSFGHGGGKIT